jgi:putative SOS response-associated peptidase YedK
MCNLYSITRSQEAMRRAFRVMRDVTGNLPSLPAAFPDTMAPIVHTARDGERELTMMRWGFPAPPNLGAAPVTNVRNLKSPYWRWRSFESPSRVLSFSTATTIARTQRRNLSR